MRILLLVLASLIVTSLQGCFPLIAAGVGAGALSIADRRSTGAQVDDGAIELKTSNRFKEQFGTAQYNVDVTSFNRHVLLTGEAASEDIKRKLAELAAAVPNVAGVTNEIIVGFTNTRAGDALITSNVKARLLTNNEGKLSPNNIKVVTENSTVFLLGLVTQAEGDAAAEIARTSKGVQRVVKVFEYIDKAPEVGTTAK
ncbi:MAG: BON domain-containing protein [Pseudomonadota bacterium]